MGKEQSLALILRKFYKTSEDILNCASCVILGIPPKLMIESNKIDILLDKITKGEISDPKEVEAFWLEAKVVHDEIIEFL
ncbi:MAG: hypothetical protein HYU84_17340 [Chloroflexi bacterium]|nr:hypothetical protein [Chloroflexota bacterium]